MSLLYLRHRLTAYHFRAERNDQPSSIAICECGWHDRVFRPGFKVRLRQLVCLVRGHRWNDEPYETHVGPAGFEESEETLMMTSEQCDFCYTVRKTGSGLVQAVDQG